MRKPVLLFLCLLSPIRANWRNEHRHVPLSPQIDENRCNTTTCANRKKNKKTAFSIGERWRTTPAKRSNFVE